MRVSVIIPCWNEGANLWAALAVARTALPGSELLIAWAAPGPGAEAAAGQRGARVVPCPQPQRAAQMNAGARAASGAVLLFLHADTILPPSASAALENALRRPDVVGGGFSRRFDSPSLFLRATCCLAEARCRSFGWFLGDQAIFVRAEVFHRLGGYRDLDRFEDLDFARRMKRAGRVKTLRPPVVSSARRFDRAGALRQTCRDFLLTVGYLKGDLAACHAS